MALSYPAQAVGDKLAASLQIVFSAALIGHRNVPLLAVLSFFAEAVRFEQMANPSPAPEPKPGRRRPDLSMNQELDGFEQLDRIAGYEADYMVFLPPGLYVWGLVDGGTENLGFAVWFWLVVSLLWTPWIALRVAMRTPKSDPHAVLAMVGVGLWPWLIFLFAMDWAVTRTGLIVTFPLIFVFGASTLMAAHFEWPRTKTTAGRSVLLCVGGVIYGVYATLFLGVLVLGVFEGAGILTVGVVAVGGAAALAALALMSAAARSTRPARP